MNNPLQIYSGSNALLYTTPINVGCRRRVSLMTEDSVTVKFSDKQKLRFPVGTRLGDYYITKEQQEKYNTATGGYDYELKFDAYYWLWANKLLFYVMPGVTNAPKETSFKLTATIDVHAAVILRCLNALGFTYDGSPFRIDTDEGFSSEAKYISYANMSILGGIQAIAEAYECEWWVVGNAIHFGKCNDTSEYDFIVSDNVASITSDSKQTAANRLVVFGSTRNLPPNYRQTGTGDITDAIVTRRLMLPEGIPYLQTEPNIPEDEIVEEEVVFDSIYPRTALTISEVKTYESTAADGTKQTFYRLKYGTSFPFSKDYILPDEELHVAFESGDMNGMHFAVKFNPLGVGEKLDDGSWNPEAQMFEVVVNEDYGRPLPDNVLHPAKGDKFSLYGWDATKMSDLGLIANAEQELLTEGNKLLAEYRKDKQTYTCPMMWDWCKAKMEANEAPVLGSIINLHFVAGDAGRKSRVIGFEHDLDLPYSNVTYICGEKVSVSRLKTLESKVEGLTHDGTKVKIQNSLDFLSKRYSDRTPYSLSVGGMLTAEQGWQTKGYDSDIMTGMGGGMDGRGNATLESLKVRSFMEIMELVTNRQTAIEGDVMLTESDTIETVTDNGDGSYTLKLHEKWEGYFTAQIEHNVLRGIYNNITSARPSGQGTTTVNNATYYTCWMRVTAVDTANNTVDVILYPDDEVPAGKNFAPEPLMKFSRWGNSGNPDDERYAMRQECLYLSSTEGTIKKLFRVTKPIIDEGNLAVSLGTAPDFLVTTDGYIRKGDQILYARLVAAQAFVTVDYKGRPLPTVRYRGPFDPAEDYYDGSVMRQETMDYERSVVEQGGCQWICSKQGTHTAPSWSNTDWTFYMGDKRFKLTLEGFPPAINPARFKILGRVKAEKGYMDVTDLILDRDIEWTRYSEDAQGNRRVASDTAWAVKHGSTAKEITLTPEDLDAQNGLPPVCIFIVTATIRDGEASEAVSAKARIS